MIFKGLTPEYEKYTNNNFTSFISLYDRGSTNLRVTKYHMRLNYNDTAIHYELKLSLNWWSMTETLVHGLEDGLLETPISAPTLIIDNLSATDTIPH